MLALTGSRVRSLGNKTVEAAVGVVAAAVAGDIFVCSVFVASCGNMAANMGPKCRSTAGLSAPPKPGLGDRAATYHTKGQLLVQWIMG